MRASRILSSLFLSSLFVAGCGSSGGGDGDDVDSGMSPDDDDDTDVDDDDTDDDDDDTDVDDDDTDVDDDDTDVDDDVDDDDVPNDDAGPGDVDAGPSDDAGPGDMDAGVDAGPVDAGNACDQGHNTCDPNAACAEPADGGLSPVCTCLDTFLGDGMSCEQPTSCADVLDLDPTAASGVYAIATGDVDADGGSVTEDVYCELETAGGGWTEGVSGDTSFDPTDPDAAGPGYTTPLTEGDMMIDFSDAPMAPGEYQVRVIIAPTDDDSDGATLQELLTDSQFANFDLNENNGSNITVMWMEPAAVDAGADAAAPDALTCATATAAWPALSNAICGAAHLVVQDQNVGVGCPGASYTLGTSVATNCTGWPQDIGTDFPAYVRIWVR